MKRRGFVALFLAGVAIGCNLIVGIGNLPGRDAGGSDAAPSDAATDATLGDAAMTDDVSRRDAATDTSLCVGVASGCDPQNCGAAGHDCLGGACLDGQCQALEIAGAQTDPHNIVIDADGGRVYWTQFASLGAIMVANKDGSGVTTLVPSQTYAEGLAYDGTTLLWFSSNSVVNISDTSGNTRQIASAQAVPFNVFNTALYNGTAYWSGFTTGSGFGASAISSNSTAASLCNAACRLVVGGLNPGAGAIFASDGGLYLIGALPTPGDAGYEGYVATAAIDGGDLRVLAKNQGFLLGMAVGSGAIYWTDYGAGLIGRAPVDGGQAAILVAGQSRPYGIALDSSRIYWTDNSLGLVMASNLDGSNLQTLARTTGNPTAIAVDNVAIYWVTQNGPTPDGGTTTSNGGVWKLAK